MSNIKTTFFRALIVAIVLSAPMLLAQNTAGIKALPSPLPAPASDRITSKDLKQLKSDNPSGFSNPGPTSQPVSHVQPDQTIYHGSIILQQGKQHTVLPPRSVIFIPEHLRQNIVSSPKGTYVPWPRFFTHNRNWIFTHSISLKQAQGKSPLRPGIEQQFERINRLVVAIHQNNPISHLGTQQAN